MKVGDLVKYIPTSLEQESDSEGTVGVIVAITSRNHRLRRGSDIWYSVLWMGDTDTHEFVKNNRLNIAEAKLADLTKYESDLGCFVGEWTEWSTNVEVQVARLQG